MANSSQRAKLAPEIRRKLAALRWRIRAYVWLHGLSVAGIWLVLTFWAGLALDYFPVLLGASEMPRVARAVLLAGVGAILAVILYRWILRRTFIRLADRSLAILLERHFGKLDESLITTVELAGKSVAATPLNRQMLATTQLQALRSMRGVRVARVLKLRPLLLSFLGAALLAITVGALYVLNAEALELGVHRLYLLGDQPWPRNARIEVVGIETTRSAAEQELDAAATVAFSDRHVKVARGSSVGLLVRADGSAPVVPSVCTVSYRTAENDRGRVNMTRVGQIRNGFQLYRYDGKPFKGILSDVVFDVLGFDHRIRDHRITVVDSPAVVRAELDCIFPDYMVDTETSSWLPRTVQLITGIRLPRGTELTLRAESNKRLQRARIVEPQSGDGSTVVLADEASTFDYSLGTLRDNLTLEITLVDADNVISEKPYRVFIEAIDDISPLVNVRLRGIGTAITPDARIALEGQITDDYGVESSWIELLVNDGQPQTRPIEAGEELASEVDFRQMRHDQGASVLQPEDKLYLVVKARDRYDLGSSANVGASDHFQLDVVTPQQLLAMLEAREFALRQRFEQIIDEMTESRDSLLRVKTEGPRIVREREAAPTDAAASTVAEESTPLAEAARRIWSLRLLRGQRAVLQSQKSAQETLGVAASFRDIRDELVNNRVDSEDRKQRLEYQVAAPLESIGEGLFPELDRRLEQLVATMDESQETEPYLVDDNPETVAAADAALEQTNAILLQMEQVLQSMKQLEDYNELLEIVRSLIDDQTQLNVRTKQEQKKQVLELFQ